MSKTPEERAAEIVKLSRGKPGPNKPGGEIWLLGDKDVFYVLVDGHPAGPFGFVQADAICCQIRRTIAGHIKEARNEALDDLGPDNDYW